MTDTPYTIAAPITVTTFTPAKPEPVKANALVDIKSGKIIDVGLSRSLKSREILNFQADYPDLFRVIPVTIRPGELR